MSGAALLRARVDWFHATKPIGVASTIGDYKQFGIHLFQLRGFTMGPEGYPVLLKTNVVPQRRPRQGQEVFLLDTGRTNANGQAVAEIWGYASECDELVEKNKRKLTLDEAKELLTNASASVLEYVAEHRDWTGIVTIETTKVIWVNGNDRIAIGEFVRIFSRYEDEPESKNQFREQKNIVFVYSHDALKFRQTEFYKSDAEAMKECGRERQVRKGVYEHVNWNGGSDKFVVDPGNVRDITPAELAATNDYLPWLGNYDWLKCDFAKRHGGENQVVKIIVHLGGHE